MLHKALAICGHKCSESCPDAMMWLFQPDIRSTEKVNGCVDIVAKTKLFGNFYSAYFNDPEHHHIHTHCLTLTYKHTSIKPVSNALNTSVATQKANTASLVLYAHPIVNLKCNLVVYRQYNAAIKEENKDSFNYIL